MPKTTPTLAELAVTSFLLEGQDDGDDARPSMRAQFKAAKNAADVCATIACLAIAGYDSPDGDWPTQQEYADYWKVDVRHAQRQWALFKRAYPGEEDPHRLARELVAHYAQRVAERNAAFAASVPADGPFAPLVAV